MITPPEIRFGGRRKLIALGDGSAETSEIPGQLGTLLSQVQPELSGQLMTLWDWFGNPHSGFYQSSIFKIDSTLPRRSVTLADAVHTDYLSVLRSGFGTSDESALYFMHGDFYFDHRHSDSGATYMYLLGAPIALDWSSMYTPHIGGSLLHNGLTVLGANSWTGNGGVVPSLSEGSGILSTLAVDSALGASKPQVSAQFQMAPNTIWTRTVELHRDVVARPVVSIRDEFSGAQAGSEKILNLNLMARGAVVTPSGSITPPAPSTLPTSTGFMSLPAGWSRFEFQGQWGVDFILMVHNSATARYQLGSFAHNWINGGEMAEFRAAHGREFQELQHQFRLWSTANSRFVLIPYRAGGARPTITTSGALLTVDGRGL